MDAQAKRGRAACCGAGAGARPPMMDPSSSHGLAAGAIGPARACPGVFARARTCDLRRLHRLCRSILNFFYAMTGGTAASCSATGPSSAPPTSAELLDLRRLPRRHHLHAAISSGARVDNAVCSSPSRSPPWCCSRCSRRSCSTATSAPAASSARSSSIPVLLSPVVVALIWKWILQRDGVLNALARRLGIEPHALAARSRLGVLLGRLRQRLGAYGLLHADPAGRAAGDSRATSTRPPRWTAASPWRTFWRITLPLLMPNLLVVIVLALIRACRSSTRSTC